MREILYLFWMFFKIGAITFGSGYVMVTVVENELVTRRKWISKETFINYMTLSTSFPGPIVINLASLIGHQRFGMKGLVAGILGAALPSFIILLTLAITFSSISSDPIVVAIFKALRPAVVGVMLVPVLSFSKNVNKWEYPIFIAIGVLIYMNIISPIILICGGVIVGLIIGYRNSKINKIENEPKN